MANMNDDPRELAAIEYVWKNGEPKYKASFLESYFDPKFEECWTPQKEKMNHFFAGWDTSKTDMKEASLKVVDLYTSKLNELLKDNMKLVNEVNELTDLMYRYKYALQNIANEDFRGNRPQSAVIAYKALKGEE